MLFDLTIPYYLTTFSGKKYLSGKVICAFFVPLIEVLLLWPCSHVTYMFQKRIFIFPVLLALPNLYLSVDYLEEKPHLGIVLESARCFSTYTTYHVQLWAFWGPGGVVE
jgi:hypothetical protein